MKITIQNDAASDGLPILLYVRDQGKPTGKTHEVSAGGSHSLELYDGAEVYFRDYLANTETYLANTETSLPSSGPYTVTVTSTTTTGDAAPPEDLTPSWGESVESFQSQTGFTGTGSKSSR